MSSRRRESIVISQEIHLPPSPTTGHEAASPTDVRQRPRYSQVVEPVVITTSSTVSVTDNQQLLSPPNGSFHQSLVLSPVSSQKSRPLSHEVLQSPIPDALKVGPLQSPTVKSPSIKRKVETSPKFASPLLPITPSSQDLAHTRSRPKYSRPVSEIQIATPSSPSLLTTHPQSARDSLFRWQTPSTKSLKSIQSPPFSPKPKLEATPSHAIAQPSLPHPDKTVAKKESQQSMYQSEPEVTPFGTGQLQIANPDSPISTATSIDDKEAHKILESDESRVLPSGMSYLASAIRVKDTPSPTQVSRSVSRSRPAKMLPQIPEQASIISNPTSDSLVQNAKPITSSPTASYSHLHALSGSPHSASSTRIDITSPRATPARDMIFSPQSMLTVDSGVSFGEVVVKPVSPISGRKRNSQQTFTSLDSTAKQQQGSVVADFPDEDGDTLLSRPQSFAISLQDGEVSPAPSALEAIVHTAHESSYVKTAKPYQMSPRQVKRRSLYAVNHLLERSSSSSIDDVANSRKDARLSDISSSHENMIRPKTLHLPSHGNVKSPANVIAHSPVVARAFENDTLATSVASSSISIAHSKNGRASIANSSMGTEGSGIRSRQASLNEKIRTTPVNLPLPKPKSRAPVQKADSATNSTSFRSSKRSAWRKWLSPDGAPLRTKKRFWFAICTTVGILVALLISLIVGLVVISQNDTPSANVSRRSINCTSRMVRVLNSDTCNKLRHMYVNPGESLGCTPGTVKPQSGMYELCSHANL